MTNEHSRVSAEGADESGNRHLTGADVQSLRQHLRMSRKQFRTLLGVSAQTLLLWEGKGPAVLRMHPRTYAAVERVWLAAFGQAMNSNQTQTPEPKIPVVPKRLSYKTPRLKASGITGNQAKAMRKRLGMLQEELAIVIGVGRSTIIKWESKGDESVAFSAETLPRVRSALKLGKRKARMLLWRRSRYKKHRFRQT